jgi:DNA-binding transcriptional ArsR family regulator
VITLEIGVADLAATRFATSPLNETIAAIRLLAEPGKTAVNAPWVRWARQELASRPVALARVLPLAVTGLDSYPEFLIPAPAVRAAVFRDELARLRATPEEAVRSSLGRVFAGVPWPASALGLAERVAPSLAAIAKELEAFHDRLIAPHWERMRAVLDADIVYRSGVLAARGVRGLFRDLHPDLRWDSGVLTFGDGRAEIQRVSMGPDGVVLVPGVFTWPDVSTRMATSSQTTLHYPARAAATVWQAVGAADGLPPDATSELLGVARARLLTVLRSPATTTSLARALGVTPGAVSQHLGVLHRAGLVGRTRSGRTVLYQVTDLGLAILSPLARGRVRSGGCAVPEPRGRRPSS